MEAARLQPDARRAEAFGREKLANWSAAGEHILIIGLQGTQQPAKNFVFTYRSRLVTELMNGSAVGGGGRGVQRPRIYAHTSESRVSF